MQVAVRPGAVGCQVPLWPADQQCEWQLHLRPVSQQGYRFPTPPRGCKARLVLPPPRPLCLIQTKPSAICRSATAWPLCLIQTGLSAICRGATAPLASVPRGSNALGHLSSATAPVIQTRLSSEQCYRPPGLCASWEGTMTASSAWPLWATCAGGGHSVPSAAHTCEGQGSTGQR